MSTTRRTGSTSGGESGAATSGRESRTATSDLPHLEPLAPALDEIKDGPGVKGAPGARKRLDYDDESVKKRWEKIIDRHREDLETDVLTITRPRTKLDPIAKSALERLVPSRDLEKEVRVYIVEKGIASEVKNVTLRLNARRMTDGRRWVLSTTYSFLLAKLFQEKEDKIEQVMKDDLGVADKIMVDLEAENGQLEKFAKLIVKSVMDRNRIHKSKTLLELVSQQVRSAI